MTDSALTAPGERDRLSVKLKAIDWTFVGLLCAIAGCGALMLYSVGGGWEPWAADHLMRFGVFLIAALVLALVQPRWWLAAAYPVYGVALLLLVAVELVGDVRMGAQRWLTVGPLSFQPSELMKIGIVLALARFYHSVTADEARWSWKLVIPAAMIAVPFGLVAHQPDLGTAMLIGFAAGTVVVLAGLDWRAIAAAAVATPIAAFAAFQFVLHDYQRRRVLTFMNPAADPSGDGYHIMQSIISIGSGGPLGRGYGLGTQSQLNFLPEKQTDFIFAALAEELGFVGCLAVLALYVAVIVSALRSASMSHNHFGRLAAAGVTATFAFYVLVNGAMVMGLAPVVGVPMPMLSYGGTVLMTVMIGFGLVLSVRVHRYDEITRGHAALF